MTQNPDKLAVEKLLKAIGMCGEDIREQVLENYRQI